MTEPIGDGVGPAGPHGPASERLRELLSLPAAQRGAKLSQWASNDPQLAQEVQSLLESLMQGTQAAASSDLGQSPDTELPRPAAEPNAGRRRVGPYRLLRLLGAGGMGEVWLAEQAHPQRQVALKLLRPGQAQGEMLARFVREANLLARVEHPGIARVYEAGSVDGVPYLAMEYVEGETLGQWFEKHRPEATLVLQLLLALARAVHVAHLRGVIHRDLKPDNILIDAEGQPKILDFGVARALDEEAGGMTRHGDLVGTLAYMSPEQLHGDLALLDARSDVYALGAIGYELLGGEPVHRLEGQSLLQALRSRERLQARPLGLLAPLLRGDVEAVIMKALATDPEQRYDSAAAMADDLQALLEDRAVRARPPGRAESLARFLRQHRWEVGAVLGLLAVLLVATAFSLRAAQREAQARSEAESRSEIAESVSGFLNELFAGADPERGLGADLPVRSLLDQAVLTLEREPPARPEVAQALHRLLGNTYANLGEYSKARLQLEAALAVEQGSERDALQLRLASVTLDQGDVEGAKASLQSLAAQAEPGSSFDLAIRSLQARVPLTAADPAGAAAASTTLLAELQALPEDAKSERLRWNVQQNLAVAQIQLGQFESAEGNLHQVIAGKQAALGAGHPEVLRNQSDLATVLDQQGRWEAAADLLREVYAEHRRIFGDDNLVTAGTLQNLAKILVERGQLEEAGTMLAEIAPIIEGQLGLDHPQTLILRGLRAYHFEEVGELVEAEAQYRAIIDSHRRRHGDDVPEALIVRNNLAMLLARDPDRTAETGDSYAALLSDARSNLGAEHFLTAIFQGNYGEFLLDRGDYGRAGPLLQSSLEGLRAALGDEHARVAKARARLERWQRQSD